MGHSLGGLTLPLVAARRPVRHLVYLCAFVPVPGRAFSDWMGDEADLFPPSTEDIWPVRDPDGLMTWPPDRAERALYPDCPTETGQWAAGLLRRHSLAPREPCPLERLPAVASSVIFGQQDPAIGAGWLRRVAQERFGNEAHELPGGHSPFLARPAALADILVSVT